MYVFIARVTFGGMSHCHSFDKSDVAKAIRRENISPFKGTLLPGFHEPPLIHRLDWGIFWGKYHLEISYNDKFTSLSKVKLINDF